MSRDGVALFLDLRHTPRSTPLNQYWALYIYVDDVDGYAAELRARGVPIDREVEDQPYGCRDFDIRDPDGHVIGIGQNEVGHGRLTLPYGLAVQPPRSPAPLLQERRQRNLSPNLSIGSSVASPGRRSRSRTGSVRLAEVQAVEIETIDLAAVGNAQLVEPLGPGVVLRFVRRAERDVMHGACALLRDRQARLHRDMQLGRGPPSSIW